MKTRFSRAALLCGVALSLSAGSAHALSLALVVTTPEPVGLGETVDVEVQIAGLAGGALPSLRSYDLTIDFDEAKLDFTGISYSSELTPGLTGGPTEVAGTVRFTQITTKTDLTPQPDAFILATLTFTAIGEGDAPLGFVNLGTGSLANQSGISLFPDLASSTGDTVTVTVPEPGLLGLLGVGLAATARRLRRRR